MKPRPKGFLSKDQIDHESEIFDYIKELHDYLWKFVRIAKPGSAGSLSEFVDYALASLEEKKQEPDQTGTFIEEIQSIIAWYKGLPKAYADVQKLLDVRRRLSALYYELSFETGQARIELERSIANRKIKFAKGKASYIKEGNSASMSDALATELIEYFIETEGTNQGIYAHMKQLTGSVAEVLNTMNQHISFQKLFIPENRTI